MRLKTIKALSPRASPPTYLLSLDSLWSTAAGQDPFLLQGLTLSVRFNLFPRGGSQSQWHESDPQVFQHHPLSSVSQGPDSLHGFFHHQDLRSAGGSAEGSGVVGQCGILLSHLVSGSVPGSPWPGQLRTHASKSLSQHIKH